MRLGTLVFMYWRRARVQPLQELLALIGVASGVALLFAVQVANTSVGGSVEELSKGITGRGTLELAARSADGFDQRVFWQVQRLPSVAAAAPLLERRVGIRGPRGRRPITLVGADERTARLGGALLRRFAQPEAQPIGLAIPSAVARAIGARPAGHVQFEVAGRSVEATVALVVTRADVGALAQSAVAVAPLGLAQEIMGAPGRITRVLVAPRAGGRREAETALTRRFGGRLNVRPSDTEARLLRHASRPNDQSTALFSAISVAVGLLFAYNAMLLTIPARRRDMAVLRLDGASDRKVLSVLAFDALVLGVVASLLGLFIGDQLSRHIFHAVPGYLAFAFPIGGQRVITTETVALAFGGGMLAALAAAARPARELFSAKPIDAAYHSAARAGESAFHFSWRASAWAGAALVVTATLVALKLPATAIAGAGVLAVAMVLLLPLVLRIALRVLDALTLRLRGGVGVLFVSLSELAATPTRSVALAATGAVAVFGIVALQGARGDLLRGLDRDARDFVGTADLWVTPGGDENNFTTQSFAPAGAKSLIARAPGIARVRAYQGSFFDLPDRRIWVIARPPEEPVLIPQSQLVSGDLDLANRRLRSRGWAAISRTIVDSRDVGVGERIGLPTPTGTKAFKVAAILTNMGWPSGAVVLNARDYRHAWRTRKPSAFEVDLAPGVAAVRGKEILRRVLGSRSALRVQTASERAGQFSAAVRQGTAKLGQIALLVLIAAALAVASAMGAAVWQRRAILAMLKADGLREARLWRALLLEAAIVLVVGSCVGATFGLYGEAFATRWLELATGFPAPFTPAVPLALGTLAAVVAIALAATAVPAYLAVRGPASAQFQD